MKKYLPYLLAMAVLLSGNVCGQDERKTDSSALVGVTQSSWNSDLGKVSFATDKTWTVGSQTWSDAVQTTNCSNKATYDGETADCHSNPDYKGDLFSWYAVDSFKNQLCPEGWRVPTKQDFFDLDIALGGTGERNADTVLLNKYLNTWGGAYGGVCYFDGSLNFQGSSASYWSQSEIYSSYGYSLNFNSDGIVHPQYNHYMSYGFTLRCVQDKK